MEHTTMTSIVSILEASLSDRWNAVVRLIQHLDSLTNNILVLFDLKVCLTDKVIDEFADELISRGYSLDDNDVWSFIDPNGHPNTIVDDTDLTLVEVVLREWGHLP